MNYPITCLRNIDDTADVKETLGKGDYIFPIQLWCKQHGFSDFPAMIGSLHVLGTEEKGKLLIDTTAQIYQAIQLKSIIYMYRLQKIVAVPLCGTATKE